MTETHAREHTRLQLQAKLFDLGYRLPERISNRILERFRGGTPTDGDIHRAVADAEVGDAVWRSFE